MRNIWTIAKREHRHYFTTPIAYVVAITILFVIGIVFVSDIGRFAANAVQSFGSTPTIAPITGVFTFMLMLTMPAITMRLISDETRMGTMELLLTAPVHNFELVVGKWLGSLLFVLTILAITLVYPLILQGLVEPGIDQGVMMTAYLGTILVASAFLGMGVGISALFTNQIAAFFVTLVTFMFFWWLVGIPTQIMQPSTGMDILRYLDMQGHFYDSFNSGRIRLDDIVYFISLTALGLFTGTIAVEVRRWR